MPVGRSSVESSHVFSAFLIITPDVLKISMVEGVAVKTIDDAASYCKALGSADTFSIPAGSSPSYWTRSVSSLSSKVAQYFFSPIETSDLRQMLAF